MHTTATIPQTIQTIETASASGRFTLASSHCDYDQAPEADHKEPDLVLEDPVHSSPFPLLAEPHPVSEAEHRNDVYSGREVG